MSQNLPPLLYIASGVLFILALRGLSSPETAREGNRYGVIGMGLAVLTTLLSRVWLRRFGGSGGRPSLNRPDEGLTGRVFRLESPIEHGFGELWIGDVHWRIAGPDLPAGRQIRIVSWDKTAGALTVVPVEAETPSNT